MSSSSQSRKEKKVKHNIEKEKEADEIRRIIKKTKINEGREKKKDVTKREIEKRKKKGKQLTEQGKGKQQVKHNRAHTKSRLFKKMKKKCGNEIMNNEKEGTKTKQKGKNCASL